MAQPDPKILRQLQEARERQVAAAKARQNIEWKIANLCNLEEGLSEWEVEFVENVSHINVAYLTARQIETICKLHKEKC